MVKRHFILLVLFLGFSASAAEDWLNLAETDNDRWEGRAGTRFFSKNKSGKEIVVASGRVFDKKAKSFIFEKWYVLNEDCFNGYEKLVTLDMQGNYKYEVDFVEKGGSVASSLAATLCYPLLEEKKEKAGKGI